ncbi:MAG: nuclear transport factor 2 family protein [Solirubrobacteraceae bacterium]|nr:nuclear transport factor 2 family protein [Patulibacter sp.]
MVVVWILVGVVLAFALRALVGQALLVKFRGDVAKLNAGDHAALLAGYADDAVLRFNPGDHRFAGDWVGREQIGRFLENFTAAGLQGEIKAIAMSGPPWALTMWARFDDHASAGDGTPLYANRTVLVVKTRWGKIVDHEDFWVDTAPIDVLDRELAARGVAVVPKVG